jgi:hypothetical protein
MPRKGYKISQKLNWNDYTSCIRYYLRLSILHVLMNFDTTYKMLTLIKCKYRKDVIIPVVIVIHHVKGPVIESVTHLQITNAYQFYDEFMYNLNVPFCATELGKYAVKIFVNSAFILILNLNVCIYTRLKIWVSIIRSNSKNTKLRSKSCKGIYLAID